jgi:hypothetical protein
MNIQWMLLGRDGEGMARVQGESRDLAVRTGEHK